MSALLETWDEIEDYTGLTEHRLRHWAARGGFEILPRDRDDRTRVFFRRDQVRAWYRTQFGLDPPGEGGGQIDLFEEVSHE